MRLDLFYPAPPGLPVPVNPPRGSSDMLQALRNFDWKEPGVKNSDLLRAGAMWIHGFLSESHEISQRIDSAEGSYWHALMHRSESDFSNSKYWFRRVGRHAIFPALIEETSKLELHNMKSKEALESLLSGSDWDPSRFVDLIEHASQNRFKDLKLVQEIAKAEYNLLMKYCLDSG
jgi:hypothetical protein